MYLLSNGKNGTSDEKIRELTSELKEYRITLAKMVAETIQDKIRLDWLSDKENEIGNVQLPSEIVLANVHSLRDAIDAAMRSNSNG